MTGARPGDTIEGRVGTMYLWAGVGSRSRAEMELELGQVSVGGP